MQPDGENPRGRPVQRSLEFGPGRQHVGAPWFISPEALHTLPLGVPVEASARGMQSLAIRDSAQSPALSPARGGGPGWDGTFQSPNEADSMARRPLAGPSQRNFSSHEDACRAAGTEGIPRLLGAVCRGQRRRPGVCCLLRVTSSQPYSLTAWEI